MRFTVSAAALVAFASAVLAQTKDFDAITSPKKDENVPAGSTFDIVWEPTAKYKGTVSLSLLGGATPSTLQKVDSIASGVSNSAGKYSWPVAKTLGKDATYGVQITLDSDSTVFQYSFPFHIKAGSGSGSGNSTYPTSKTGATSYTTHSSGYKTATYSGNLSTTASTYPTGKVTLTSTAVGTVPTKTSTPSSVGTNGAQSVAAGSLAMLGGLAVAVLAL